MLPELGAVHDSVTHEPNALAVRPVGAPGGVVTIASPVVVATRKTNWPGPPVAIIWQTLPTIPPTPAGPASPGIATVSSTALPR